jgi:hypothetical protein
MTTAAKLQAVCPASIYQKAQRLDDARDRARPETGPTDRCSSSSPPLLPDDPAFLSVA